MATSALSSSTFCSSRLSGTNTFNSGLRCTLWTKNTHTFLRQKSINQKRSVYVSAEYKKRGGPGDFVAGFVIGGALFGALGCIFAPQVNKFLSVVERELDESLKKLPKGLDDDEGLEKTRKNLNEKIAQLNAAIDDVSAQLRADDGPSSDDVTTAELESAT